MTPPKNHRVPPVVRGRLWLVACALALIIPPTAAWAGQVTYVGPGASICCWTGYQDNGTFVVRSYNNIYHSCASYTSQGGSDVEYQNANRVPVADSTDGPGPSNCVNPTHLGGSGGNQRYAYCGAANGGQVNVTNVTCQTTRP
jgi:hypothetical protein